MDLATPESVDLEHPLRLEDWPPTAWRAVADGLVRHGAILRVAAALPLEWMYPSDGSKAAPVFPLSGKRVVFTGKMTGGSREEMQAEARRLGAVVQTAVGAATDYLVCGEKVGDVKLAKARKLGVTVIDEAGYRDLLDRNGKGGP